MRRIVPLLTFTLLLIPIQPGTAATSAPEATSTPKATAVPKATAAPKAKPAPQAKPAPEAKTPPERNPALKGPEFPSNEAGRHAEAWFEAFNKGDEAMREYIRKHVASEALKRRSLDDRMEIYQGMRSERGTVTPLEVEEFTESRVKAIARGARGGRFAITFLCEEEPPHGLLNLRVEDLPPEEGTPEGMDDGGYSEAPLPRMTPVQVTAALRSMMDSLAHADAFSGAVLLAKGDRVLLRRAYGLASRRFGTPNRPDTKFNLGSINKAFTRLAIEQLAGQGKLKLDDTIDRYVPEYPREAASKITIQMLLDHRAGVPDIFGPKYATADRTGLRTVADYVELIRDQPLQFEPGTRQAYSNGGYVLLGAVIEKITGTSYFDYVRKNIYEVAGMKDTDSYELDDPIANVAAGYTKESGRGTGWRESFTRQPGRGSPAGGGYSTVDDLLRFAQALRSGKLGTHGEGGMGIAGGAPGINAMLLMERDWTLIALANMDPPAAERVAFRAGRWLRSGEPRGGGPGQAEHRVSARPAYHEEMGPEPRPASTRIPDAGVAVPMTWAGHLAAVSVRINGQGPFRFAIDTGAAGCARIDPEVAERLGLPVIGEARVGDPSGKNAQTRQVVRLDSLTIGEARFGGLTATAGMPPARLLSEKVDGVLGFGLFADCLFTLDYPALRMTLAGGAVPADAPDVIPFTNEDGIPNVTLRVAGVEVPAHIDVGAMGGISLPESFAAKLPLSEPPHVVGRARTVSNEFEIKAAKLDGDVALGGVTFQKPMVEFQPIFPMGNVGARVLRDFVLTFDQKNHRLRMARSA